MCNNNSGPGGKLSDGGINGISSRGQAVFGQGTSITNLEPSEALQTRLKAYQVISRALAATPLTDELKWQAEMALKVLQLSERK
jgi:hypothetical protein